jgi:hypothetical protein
MELNESRSIVKTLAQGVHPSTGEVFPPDSPYNDPEVIRALFFILGVGNSAKKPKKSTEERRRDNLDLGRPRNAGLPWSEEDRSLVKSRFLEGTTIERLAAELERSSAAIVAEIIRQDLVPPNLR